MISVKQFFASVLLCALILAASECGVDGQSRGVANCAARATQPAPLNFAGTVAAIWWRPVVRGCTRIELRCRDSTAAASTYPTQIVAAERWLQQNSSLKGAQLASEVDKRSWDPSAKRL